MTAAALNVKGEPCGSVDGLLQQGRVDVDRVVAPFSDLALGFGIDLACITSPASSPFTRGQPETSHDALLPIPVQVTLYPFGNWSALAVGAINGVTMTMPNRQAAAARTARRLAISFFMTSPSQDAQAGGSLNDTPQVVWSVWQLGGRTN